MTDEVLASYWTVSGLTEPAVGREWSLFGWPDRCREAAKAGFAGLALWHAGIEHRLESRSLAELIKVFADAGLSCLEAEFLADFFADPADPARAESDRRRRLPFAQVAYAFTPFDANVLTLDAAPHLVAVAAQPNGGLAIDTWHMAKLGITPAELRRVPQYLAWAELSDGQLADMPDLGYETLSQLPGEGEFDLAGYVAALRAVRYQGPWGVEVIRAKQRGLPIDAEFRHAGETTAAVLRGNQG
jgi:sugar phosphate isomerase/epimerase